MYGLSELCYKFWFRDWQKYKKEKEIKKLTIKLGYNPTPSRSNRENKLTFLFSHSFSYKLLAVLWSVEKEPKSRLNTVIVVHNHILANHIFEEKGNWIKFEDISCIQNNKMHSEKVNKFYYTCNCSLCNKSMCR